MLKKGVLLLFFILSISTFSMVTYADDTSEYVDKPFYAYDEPSFTSAKANHGAAYEPLTITVKEKRNDGWWKVVTWEGEKWINTTGERKYIDKKFYAYNESSFTSEKGNSGGAYEPLTLTVTDGNPQGWLKVVTWEGEKWINTTGERKYIDKKFYAYNESSFTSEKGNSGGAYEPLTLTVTDGNPQGWLKVVTWEGEKWINTTGERKYIDKKFYAYNEPSFTSAKANFGGAYEPLTLTVTDGNSKGWLKVVTWEGEKWINTTGERKYIDKKFYAYNEPSFTSAKANSGGAYEPLTLTVTDGNTQGWLKVVTWEGEKWINLNYENQVVEFYVESTAYSVEKSPPNERITAAGIDIGKNPNIKLIAVDPKVIPLGTKVNVEGYGEAIAGDTGGAIKGKKIDVLFPTEKEARQWGRKMVKIQIMK
ncbi:3D domain-containing protein [Bacillus cereus]|nr:3D domain-containing protein [Bacillus cereus]